MSVTIPASVTSIGGERPPWDAFGGCGELAKITVAAGNSAFSSADGVLFDKDKTALLLFPAGKGGDYAIPSSVTGIGNGAFAYCSGLTSITIPSSVTGIGPAAFYECSGLTSVTFAGSAIDFYYDPAFPDSLENVYFSGGAGTYTRAAGGWTKQ
jgi:hypothetical protein